MPPDAHPIRIAALYQFTPLDSLAALRGDLLSLCRAQAIKGTLLLAREGINGTIAGSDAGITAVIAFLRALPGCADLGVKYSHAEAMPFKRLKVRLKAEIVSMGQPHIDPLQGAGHYVEAAAWNALIADPGTVVIDTRNAYEVKIGTFARAINPATRSFREFPAWFRAHRDRLLAAGPQTKVAMFCTGGIRCEKGILELQQKGYKNVYQLHGGILNYLKELPNSQFEGECFVFDQRVAVDQNLKPSQQYKLCPHCGQPGKTPVDCKRCDTHTFICEDCAELDWKKDTCSKNCAYQYELHPERKGVRQERG